MLNLEQQSLDLYVFALNVGIYWSTPLKDVIN